MPDTPAASSSGVLVNLRDVSAPAEGLLKRGVLWRSEAPHAGDADPDGLTWPPPTVIDLRDRRELGGRPHPLSAAGTHIVELPLNGALAPAEQARLREGDLTLADLYGHLLDGCAAWLPRLVHVAATAPGPILLHCAAGKDRTGITAALLLRLAGVGDDVVLADYRATADVLDDLVGRLDLVDERGRPVPRHLVGITDDGIRGVLARLGDDPAGFARAHGVTDADLDAWRTRIRAA